MAKRRYESEESYDDYDSYDSQDGYDSQDDSRDSYDSQDELEDDELPTDEDLRNRAILVLTSSYGISALIHIGLILAAFLFYWTTIEVDNSDKHVLLPQQKHQEQKYDHKKKRDLHRKPEVKHEKQIEKVIKELEEEVEKTTDVPKGTSFDNQSNKNLDSTAVVDAVGVGGGAAGAYGSRFGKGSLTHNGGSEGTESAVLAALWWLQRHQDADGKWGAGDFPRNCGKDPDGQSVPTCSGHDMRSRSGKGPGAGEGHYDVGVTGLALLAFLGNGTTHKASPIEEFRISVKNGLRFLKKKQQTDGSMGVGAEFGPEGIYNHCIATMALCEAYILSQDFTIKRSAQKAVDWLVKAQNPGLGWKYEPHAGKNDTSVTGWAVLALKSAHAAELNVPKTSFDGALNWFERATSTGGKDKRRLPGLVGYERPGDGGSMINRKAFESELGYRPQLVVKFEGAPTMTAVAVLCRVFTGQPREHERVRQGLKVMMDRLPRWDGAQKSDKNETNFYYWYYGTYGVFQATKHGSSEWDKWNKAMQEAILGDGHNRQRMGGCEDGSWDPIDEWGIPGGRVYSTATNALTLEIYYRYERQGAK
ncbi:MAG: hypothetical protein ACYTFT_07970 [Planctomycetota bacterium]|jgi:hypothetical protein